MWADHCHDKLRTTFGIDDKGLGLAVYHHNLKKGWRFEGNFENGPVFQFLEKVLRKHEKNFDVDRIVFDSSGCSQDFHEAKRKKNKISDPTISNDL